MLADKVGIGQLQVADVHGAVPAVQDFFQRFHLVGDVYSPDDADEQHGDDDADNPEGIG